MLNLNLIILVFYCSDLAVKPALIHSNRSKLTWCLLFVLFVLVHILSDHNFITPIVNINQGELVGIYNAKDDINMYLGIPYTDVPERFKGPTEPKKWEGLFRATSESDRCSQIAFSIYTGKEDCLYLNVFTPKPAVTGKKYPVMLFIHGGAFIVGSGSYNVYYPTYLVRNDVILVTFNYRLGAFGFLCLHQENAPGNIGLKDQLAAIRWVKKNIAAFGGDDENVTLFGESAGGVSVSYHLLSPKSAGLFHRAIIHSGSALSAWSIAYDPLERTIEALHQFGVYNITEPNDIVDYLKGISAVDLAKISAGTVVNIPLFPPCVEKEFDEIESFLVEAPITLLKNGNFTKIPTITGYNNMEGLFFHSFIVSIDNFGVSNINITSRKDKDEIFRRIDEFYFKNKTVNDEIDLYTDAVIGAPLVTFTRLVLNKTNEPVFSYNFKYSGFRNFVKLVCGPTYDGATHADELFYIFDLRHMPFNPIARDQFIIDEMANLWTNFAKYGDPTPELPTNSQEKQVKWFPSTSQDIQVLEIDTELKMADMPAKDRMQFWTELYDEYGLK